MAMPDSHQYPFNLYPIKFDRYWRFLWLKLYSNAKITFPVNQYKKDLNILLVNNIYNIILLY